ncbi:MAG: hypothetical protein WC875_01875 [Candidatus Absconditabacterales bacterium]
MKTVNDVKTTLSMIQTITQKHPHANLSEFLQDIIIQRLQKEKDIAKITSFFCEIYDKLYYDILFKNIKIEKRVIRLLESLAGPDYDRVEKQWKKLIKKTTQKK